MEEKLRARIFISCGQMKDTEEEKIAYQLKDRLYSEEYEPYVAIKEQTTKGLKENIFSMLEKSEYILFIDFKREQLYSSGKKIYRGSLFSNQELAIAAYLEISIIAFQEEEKPPI